MKKQFELIIEAECEALGTAFNVNVVLTVDDDLDTLLPYLFKKKYGKAYNELSWYLEDGAREFVNNIEDKWLHNQLDTDSIFNEPDFLEYVICETENEAFNKALDAVYARVKEQIEKLDDDEIRQLYQENVGSVTVDLYYNGIEANMEVDIPLVYW